MAHPETDEQLIQRLTNPEDQEAWNEFVRLYRPVIFDLATQNDLQPQDAEDVTQEIILRVREASHQWNAKGKFRSWLRRLARNLAIKYIESLSKEEETISIADLLTDLPEDKDLPSEAFDIQAASQAMLWAYKRVQSTVLPSTWEAWKRVKLQGEDPSDVAESMNMTRTAIYSASTRVQRQLERTVRTLDCPYHPQSDHIDT